MKINAISAMSYNSGVQKANFKQNNSMSAPMQKDLLEYPKGYMPYQINFGKGNYSKLPGIKLLKTVSDLPCLYCAQKMVSANTIDALSVQNAKITRSLGELSNKLAREAERYNDMPIFTKIMNDAVKFPKMNAQDYLEGISKGKVIVPEKIMNMATRQMNGVEYAQKAINTISKYEDGLMPVEKEVFGMIKASFKKNPNQTISQIMSELRKNRIGNFSESQTKILDEIEEIAKSTLTKQTKDKVLFETQRSKNLLSATNSTYPFKRKKLIENLNKIGVSKHDVEGMAKIIEKAETIPTSSGNANAFIAKYTNRNIPQGKGASVARSDQEIVQRLLDPSRQSVEHIRPQVTFKTSSGDYVGAKDVMPNLALAHKQCNSDRGHLTLEEYMRDVNPKAKESIQKHVDFLIKEIKAGKLKGLEEYPQQLKETFAHETGGKLNLDISEIKDYMDKFLAKKKA